MGQLLILLIMTGALLMTILCVISSLLVGIRQARVDKHRRDLLKGSDTSTSRFKLRRSKSAFQKALDRSRDKARISQDALLAWVVSSGRRIDEDRYTMLRAIGGNRESLIEFDLAVDAGREAQMGDLLLACQVTRSLPDESRRTFLRQATLAAVADGRLDVTANYILRFYADLAELDLQEVFHEVTRTRLPFAGDPSSIRWWQKRERTRRRRESSPSGSQMTRREALCILGLEEEAPLSKVRKAYHRLAILNHPDRFADLGEEAERSAVAAFSRIQQAYELLKQP